MYQVLRTVGHRQLKDELEKARPHGAGLRSVHVALMTTLLLTTQGIPQSVTAQDPTTTLSIPASLLVSDSASASRNDQIKPEELGLPSTNIRTSEPFVNRIYKKDEDGKPLKTQPQGYPFTPPPGYECKDDEVAQPHYGADYSSRTEAGTRPVPLDFKAGVYGVVVKAGDGPWGTIAVQIQDGSVIQYMHTTASHVRVGDLVTPETKLGVTGRTGAGVIHLHIQAKNKLKRYISPDLAFRAGRAKLESQKTKSPNVTSSGRAEKTSVFFDNSIPKKASTGNDNTNAATGTAPSQKKTMWIAQVEGGNPNAALSDGTYITLGRFNTYEEAKAAEKKWDDAHPGNLRLSREFEVLANQSATAGTNGASTGIPAQEAPNIAPGTQSSSSALTITRPGTVSSSATNAAQPATGAMQLQSATRGVVSAQKQLRVPVTPPAGARTAIQKPAPGVSAAALPPAQPYPVIKARSNVLPLPRRMNSGSSTSRPAGYPPRGGAAPNRSAVRPAVPRRPLPSSAARSTPRMNRPPVRNYPSRTQPIHRPAPAYRPPARVYHPPVHAYRAPVSSYRPPMRRGTFHR
jgi:murein DD-endopeptidase MepM/ murein hydrolase activator NlpD